jgi:hypothetical protein
VEPGRQVVDLGGRGTLGESDALDVREVFDKLEPRGVAGELFGGDGPGGGEHGRAPPEVGAIGVHALVDGFAEFGDRVGEPGSVAFVGGGVDVDRRAGAQDEGEAQQDDGRPHVTPGAGMPV